MKCLINFFKRLLGRTVTEEMVQELPVPEEHRIEMPEVACEMQENLDKTEIELEVCPVCKENPCICHNEVKNICPKCDSEQCTCENVEKVEEPVKKKHRGRPRKKQNKNNLIIASA